VLATVAQVSERPDRGSLLLRIVGGIGRVLITVGVLLLLFVAYQLWGTGIRTAQAQNELEDDLAATLEAAEGAGVGTDQSTSTSTSLDPASTTTTTTPGSSSTVPALPAELVPAEGEAAGRIVAPAIGIDWVFVEGVSVADLKLGPGHYPETPMPGQAGNAAIAGHRTTYGQPFHNLDQLVPGDEIVLTTVQGQFTYQVRQTVIVRPDQVEVLGATHWDFDGDPATPHNALTLTACHPKRSARERIVVAAELVGEPAPTPASDDDDPVAPTEFEGDLSGERAAATPAIVWGIACAAIWLIAWAIGRRKRSARWVAYAVGLVPFLVALFFFFESFSTLLPANY
jgi:sortase A